MLHGRLVIAIFSLAGVLIWTAAWSADPPRRSNSMEARNAQMRQQMVTNFIEAEGIDNPLVLNAMRTVPRHEFVEPQYRDQAYWDLALPIGFKQTISPPFIVAYMTDMLDPQPDDKVLEIGTGSGYQAAVLGAIAKEVYTIEIVEPLGKRASDRFKDLEMNNVHSRIGDGYLGWPEEAPFDKIIVTCSPEKVPQPLIDQLKDGGRLIIPLGERYQQVFYLFEKKDGELIKQRLIPTLFVPMTGKSEDLRQVQPDPAHPELRNGSFEALIKETAVPENWHYQRQMTLMEGDSPDGKYHVQFQNAQAGRIAQCLQGFPVDGRRVNSLHVELWVKAEEIPLVQRGQREQAALMVHFFDQNRKPLGQSAIGPWSGTFDWKRTARDLNVPLQAREAIVQVGLNGTVGTLSVDNIRLTPSSK